MKGLYTKYLLATVAAVTVALSAAGQDIASFRAELAMPDSLGSRVTVSEYGSAADAVRTYDQSPKAEKISGYRIRIFFDNGQNARSEALATQERFRKEFPGIPTFLAYENPTYIVTVGNCVTMDEALLLWNEVRHSFSTAFLWRGEIPVSEILRREEIPADSIETETTDTLATPAMTEDEWNRMRLSSGTENETNSNTQTITNHFFN